jgi:hypothetical protein
MKVKFTFFFGTISCTTVLFVLRRIRKQLDESRHKSTNLKLDEFANKTLLRI